MKKRIVVTGLGIISSLGTEKDKFWNNLIGGKSQISNVSKFYITNYPLLKAALVKNYEPSQNLPKDIGRASQFAIDATISALADAGLSNLYMKEKRMGIVCGTTNGESNVLEEIDRIWIEKGEDEVWARTIVKYPIDSLSRSIAAYFNIKGFSQVMPTACAAGNYSIGYGYDLIKNGRADIMIVGGSDPLTRYAFAGFGRLFAIAPEKCQPFDKNRKGILIGEGAGILILETLESARKRKANIYAEILGYGLSCDANHMTAPRTEGIIKVIERAIKNSNINKNEIDYICAHGTGTPSNDKTECEAIKKVFKNSVKNIAISSIKSMLGHTMGAASAIEAIACCLAIKKRIIPPTINYETPDPECDIDCVPNSAREKPIRVALNNSYAFGGNNAILAIGKI